ncbi:MAG: HlyD family efflux transporter periplasmic adaptor subunit [Caldilineaceae bacterium]
MFSLPNPFPVVRLRFCLLVLLLITTGCRFGNKLPPPPEPLAPNETLLNGFETYTVQRGDIVAGVQFSGAINLRRQTELFFEQDGRVKTIHVQNGDFVRADAVLAELDIAEIQIQLTEAEWDLEIVRQDHAIAAEERTYAIQLAEQAIKIAELTLASLLAKELDKPGSVLPEEMAKAEQALTVAQLDLKRLDRSEELAQQKELITAEVNVRRLQEQIDQSRLVAPFDGNVYFILPVEDLQRLPATAYEPVVRLVDPSSLTVEANVPESEMELLTETMPVSVSLTYRPGIVLPGVIQQLPFPFGTGGDTLVHITVPEAEQNKLRVGGAVEVYAEVQRQDNVLWLPPQALREVGNQFYAFVQSGETEREVLVQVGLRTDERVEIIAGLLENEIVVRK